VNTLWWILLPVLTPVIIMVAALALHHLERNVLVSAQEAMADASMIDHHRTSGVRNGR
jgi:hypothetical protein